MMVIIIIYTYLYIIHIIAVFVTLIAQNPCCLHVCCLKLHFVPLRSLKDHVSRIPVDQLKAVEHNVDVAMKHLATCTSKVQSNTDDIGQIVHEVRGQKRKLAEFQEKVQELEGEVVEAKQEVMDMFLFVDKKIATERHGSRPGSYLGEFSNYNSCYNPSYKML